MKYIKVENFGPIREGFVGESEAGEGMMPILPVTFFCGNQGEGKSTIAKLISIFSWIEKGLVRGDIVLEEKTHIKRYFEKQCKFHRIQNYVKDTTRIEYIGEKYKFIYQYIWGFWITKIDEEGSYLMPKIMYIPAERNLLSVIDNIGIVKDLPDSLFSMLTEYDKAKKTLISDLYLPVDGYKYHYDKEQDISYLVGNDYKLKLSESASGFQSMVPMFLVTQYLTHIITNKESVDTNIELQSKVDQRIKKLLEDDTLSEVVRRALIGQQANLFRYDKLVNIVEEPEMNLYPTAQRDVLYSLLWAYNYHENNELVITTHSPYMIDYLSLSIKAHDLQKGGKVDMGKLNKIVKREYRVDGKKVGVYELHNGRIERLNSFENMPSDENFLNMELEDINDKFDDLLALEEA